MLASRQEPNATQKTRSPESSEPVRERVGQGRAANPILHLQRTIGNRAVQKIVGVRAIQRSAFSDDLQRLWTQQDREAFFARLAMQVSDQDVDAFVERTLTGADLRRARRILGTDRPLSDAQRNALLTLLVSRLGSAETFISAAAQQVNEAIRSEQAAQVDLIVALVTIGMTYVVPGLSGAITRLVSNIPASASTGIAAIARGIKDRAGPIASALGEAGKRATPPAIRAALTQSPRDFLNAFVQGFAAAKDEVVSYIAANIQDRQALPDEELWLYVSNWDPTERTIAGYVEGIRGTYDRWLAQVDPIGEQREGRRSTLEHDRPYTTQVGIVWVRHASGDVLVQARAVNGRLTFRRFIDEDLRDSALARAQTTQPRGVQSVPWGPPHIFEMPASIPDSAARR